MYEVYYTLRRKVNGKEEIYKDKQDKDNKEFRFLKYESAFSIMCCRYFLENEMWCIYETQISNFDGRECSMTQPVWK